MLEARLTAAIAIALLAAILRGAEAEGPLSFEDASANLRGDHPEERSRDIGWNGAAWFDFDRDGLLDLFVARGTSQSNTLFRNLGAAPLPTSPQRPGSPTAAAAAAP